MKNHYLQNKESGLKDKILNAIDFLIENQDEESLFKVEAALHAIAKTLQYKKAPNFLLCNTSQIVH